MSITPLLCLPIYLVISAISIILIFEGYVAVKQRRIARFSISWAMARKLYNAVWRPDKAVKNIEFLMKYIIFIGLCEIIGGILLLCLGIIGLADAILTTIRLIEFMQ